MDGNAGPIAPAGTGGEPASSVPAPGTVARILPAAEPGPTIRKASSGAPVAPARAPARAPAAKRTRGSGRPVGRPRKDGTAATAGRAMAPASVPAPSPGESRDLAASIYSQHERAARWLGQPALAITRAEAGDVAEALGSLSALTGFAPSGPLWTWLSVLYVLGGVYGGKIALLLAAKAEAAEQAQARAGQAPAQARQAVPARVDGNGPLPAAAPRAPLAQITPASSPPAPPPVAQVMPAPISSSAERLGEL